MDVITHRTSCEWIAHCSKILLWSQALFCLTANYCLLEGAESQAVLVHVLQEAHPHCGDCSAICHLELFQHVVHAGAVQLGTCATFRHPSQPSCSKVESPHFSSFSQAPSSLLRQTSPNPVSATTQNGVRTCGHPTSDAHSRAFFQL